MMKRGSVGVTSGQVIPCHRIKIRHMTVTATFRNRAGDSRPARRESLARWIAFERTCGGHYGEA